MHRPREEGPKSGGLMVFCESTGGEVWLGTWGLGWEWMEGESNEKK